MTIDRAPAVRLSGHAPQRRKTLKCTRKVHPAPGDEKCRSVNHLTVESRCRWQAPGRARWIRRGGPMQMHQIRYFLALCEECNFTRAAKRCGVSQPSLTNAIIGLEQGLGGALFQRKPLIALTALGHAVHPYLDRIAENADHARQAAEVMADVRRSPPIPLPPSGLSMRA